MENSTLIVAGLGNPGRQYSNTWHNLGFKAIDYMANKFGANFRSGKGSYLTADLTHQGQKIILLKPATFMNLSGQPLIQALSYYKLTVANLLVIYDDISLNMGYIRFRSEGSAGGHNGVKSIITSLATNNFNRIRMGFNNNSLSGALKNNPSALADVVLSEIPSKLKDEVDLLVDKSFECLTYFLDNGSIETMNKYNQRQAKTVSE